MIAKAPTHCPRVDCPQHLQILRGFGPHGLYRRRSYPQLLQRFRCRECRNTFSITALTLEYRCQRLGLNFQILKRFAGGVSNAEIARNLNCSQKLVRERLKLLSRQGMLQQSLRTENLKIAETISYDGVENFARSQYEPNNVQQAIGAQSLFIYDFNFIVMNRKGRMSPRQRLRKAYIESVEGCFPGNAIRAHSVTLFKRLLARCDTRLHLCSDEHYQYRRAIEIDLKGQPIHHQTISSKATRVFKHILFPVNHADLLLRQHVKACARETISFSKTHAAMAQKYALFMVWKNFFRTQFVKPHKRDPLTNRLTPAMRLGVMQTRPSFHEFFDRRLTPSHTKLNDDWAKIYADVNPCPRVLHRKKD